MIGHYLNVQNEAAEDRLLTCALTPGSLYANGRRCLVGVVEDWHGAGSLKANDPRLKILRPRLTMWVTGAVEVGEMRHPRHSRANHSVFHRFDALCARFGIERTTAAIRNRILSNQARRVLTPEHEYAMVLR